MSNASNSELASSDNRRLARIEIYKESLHFSAAHFTIFSESGRENLHGHDFKVTADVQGLIDRNGLCFDYTILKNLLQACCNELDEKVLLPTRSPYLWIEESDNEPRYRIRFANESISFLSRDALLLPLKNITVEELGHWFLDQLCASEVFRRLPILALRLYVSSGVSQRSSVEWQAS